jgi:diphthine-ammonia ligase
MFSGGKDSCYSVWLSQHQAWDVERLVTVRPESRDSWMFHYPNVEWTVLQAKSMGLQHTLVSTGTDELQLLEETLRELKVEDRLDGLVTGAVASEFQKTRFDYVCDRVGLKSFSPLWHKKAETILEDLVAAGFRIVMSGVAASGLDGSWLGRELTPTDWNLLKVVSTRFGIHLAGEGGEYETFVIDAPQFSTPISIIESEKVWHGQSGHLKITRASMS